MFGHRLRAGRARRRGRDSARSRAPPPPLGSALLSSVVVLPVALPTFLLHLPRRPSPVAPVAHRARRRRSSAARSSSSARSGRSSGTSAPLPLDPPGWAAGLPGIERAFAVGLVLVVGSGVRRPGGARAPLPVFDPRSERQSLRLLVVMIVAMAIATALALVTVLASRGCGLVLDRDRAGGPRRRLRGPDRDPGRHRRRRPHLRPLRRRRRGEEDRRVRRPGDLLRAPARPPQPPRSRRSRSSARRAPSPRRARAPHRSDRRPRWRCSPSCSSSRSAR